MMMMLLLLFALLLLMSLECNSQASSLLKHKIKTIIFSPLLFFHHLIRSESFLNTTIIFDRLSQAVFWWFILFMCFFFFFVFFLSHHLPRLCHVLSRVSTIIHILSSSTVSMVRLFTFKCPIQSRNNRNQSKWILFSHRLQCLKQLAEWAVYVTHHAVDIYFGILLGMYFFFAVLPYLLCLFCSFSFVCPTLFYSFVCRPVPIVLYMPLDAIL